LADQLPAQDGELAGGGDDRDLHAAAAADAFVESAKRTGDACGGESGLDEHPACVRSPLFGDPSVYGGMAAGLADARVEAEVADELVGGAEASEVADGGDDRERNGGVDAGDRHQPLHL